MAGRTSGAARLDLAHRADFWFRAMRWSRMSIE
jgi:hypothetical protein